MMDTSIPELESEMDAENRRNADSQKQIEEAEEIAALNLAKFRQAQANVADATERAYVNEQALAKAKARSRDSSLAPVSNIIYFLKNLIFFVDVNW